MNIGELGWDGIGKKVDQIWDGYGTKLKSMELRIDHVYTVIDPDLKTDFLSLYQEGRIRYKRDHWNVQIQFVRGAF